MVLMCMVAVAHGHWQWRIDTGGGGWTLAEMDNGGGRWTMAAAQALVQRWSMDYLISSPGPCEERWVGLKAAGRQLTNPAMCYFLQSCSSGMDGWTRACEP
eukprot:366156-Chlamydomonas_euryale.AAC.6